MAATDPVLQQLIDVLNAEGPAALKKRYVIGDPVLVTPRMLPMCFISRDTTSISIASNTEDMYAMPIVLNVVYDGAGDLKQKSFTQAGALALYDLCEGRNADYQLRSDTLAGVLRAHQVLNGNKGLYIDIGTDTEISYLLSPPSRRAIFSVEAVIRTTLKLLQVRP